MNTLYDQIVDKMKSEIYRFHRYTEELYGYGANLPSYRILKRKLYVDYINEDGELVENILFESPESLHGEESYQSLVELRVHTGLLYMPLHIDDLKREEFTGDLCEIINRMYENKYNFVAFRLVLEDEIIEKMYKKIANTFDVNI